LHHAISAVAWVCAEVIVVGPPAGPDPDLPADAPVRLVRDQIGGEGPLAGLAAGLAGTRTRLALVAGGDMPGLSRDVLLRMLEVAVSQPVQAVALSVGADVQPLPLVVSVGRAARAATALLDSGERRLGALLDVLQLTTVDEPVWRALDPRGQTLRDVDVPADLER
jgi:molybdopterin-guanine dinucleotide biosynthesis protein A